MERQPDFLLTDADNTLWDTNGVFEAAQLNLLDAIESKTEPVPDGVDRLAFLRKFDQEIARTHSDGLRYPVRELIQRLVLELTSGKRQAIPPDEMSVIERDYYMQLKRRPRLRWGVRKTLQDLRKSGTEIWVISEGAENRIQQAVEEHELQDLVSKVVSGKKTADFFRQLKKSIPRSHTVLMVGDQLDRDILPASEAGLLTAYFPGGFEPDWTEHDLKREADLVISSFSQLLKVFHPNIAA